MSQRIRYLRSSVAMVAVVAMVLPAPLQAVLADGCRCDCCAEREAFPGDATHRCDPSAIARSDRLQTADSVDRAPGTHCPCCAATAQHDDTAGGDHGIECRRCPRHSKRHPAEVLWARLMNVNKKGKQKALLLATDCLHPAPCRIAQRRPMPDDLLAFMPATERCTVLCRFLL